MKPGQVRGYVLKSVASRMWRMEQTECFMVHLPGSAYFEAHKDEMEPVEVTLPKRKRRNKQRERR